VLVSGGKYTTYRAMAKDVVDVAVERESLAAGPSRTETYPIVGAEGFDEMWADRNRLAAEANLSVPQFERLLRRYGSLVGDVLELARDDPKAREEISGSGGYLRAEVSYAVSHEGARHLDDVVVRRTRISIETPDRGAGCAVEVAQVMAQIMSWKQKNAESEINRYLDQVKLEMHEEEMETLEG
jgi:glycerol-3-phosphate dehydrogenase